MVDHRVKFQMVPINNFLKNIYLSLNLAKSILFQLLGSFGVSKYLNIRPKSFTKGETQMNKILTTNLTVF